MNKLISANYWFGCDWWLCEVGYLGMHADQLSLACAGVYLWNTGHLRVTDPRMCSGFQQKYLKTTDAQAVWKEYSEYMTTSSKGASEKRKLTSYITNTVLDS